MFLPEWHMGWPLCCVFAMFLCTSGPTFTHHRSTHTRGVDTFHKRRHITTEYLTVDVNLYSRLHTLTAFHPTRTWRILMQFAFPTGLKVKETICVHSATVVNAIAPSFKDAAHSLIRSCPVEPCQRIVQGQGNQKTKNRKAKLGAQKGKRHRGFQHFQRWTT